MKNSSDELQHPRRNLGQRFRSQSERFVKLALRDAGRRAENLAWAEQNARQAILHDFTDYRNWIVLAKTKKLLGDSEGLRLVLEDVFTVLGRDPENLEQLMNLDYLKVGEELLAATLIGDPLDPDLWWSKINEGDLEEQLNSFKGRCKILDFRDYRANIVYGRRLERIISDGREDLFIELVQYLLAHRPTNHELWTELGKLHEKRGEHDDAWLCYDNVQQLIPTLTLRDNFLERITNKFEKTGGWSAPSVDVRVEFNKRMGALADRLSGTKQHPPVELDVEVEEIPSYDKSELDKMFEEEEYQAAFFLSRKLISQGEGWALDYFENAKKLLIEDVHEDE